MSLEAIAAPMIVLISTEKAELLKRLAFELIHTSPGIDQTPGAAGGEACIAYAARILARVLHDHRRLEWSEARILENYLTRQAADLVNACAYAESQPEEIEHAQHKNGQA